MAHDNSRRPSDQRWPRVASRSASTSAPGVRSSGRSRPEPVRWHSGKRRLSRSEASEPFRGRRVPQPLWEHSIPGARISPIGWDPSAGRAKLMNHSNFRSVVAAFLSRRFFSSKLSAIAANEFPLSGLSPLLRPFFSWKGSKFASRLRARPEGPSTQFRDRRLWRTSFERLRSGKRAATGFAHPASSTTEARHRRKLDDLAIAACALNGEVG